MAAEIGTRKVINEHSTIGLVVTTDGSISDIPREEYQEAEERVIGELQEINKPFVVLLNCHGPQTSRRPRSVQQELEDRVRRAGAGRSAAWIWSEEDIRRILDRGAVSSSRCGRSPCSCPGGLPPAGRTTGCDRTSFDSITRAPPGGESAISGTLPTVPGASGRASMWKTRR